MLQKHVDPDPGHSLISDLPEIVLGNDRVRPIEPSGRPAEYESVFTQVFTTLANTLPQSIQWVMPVVRIGLCRSLLGLFGSDSPVSEEPRY